MSFDNGYICQPRSKNRGNEKSFQGAKREILDLDLVFHYGFEKFRVFLHGNHKGYDWDCILPSHVEEVVKDGGDYEKYEHVKAVRKGP